MTHWDNKLTPGKEYTIVELETETVRYATAEKSFLCAKLSDGQTVRCGESLLALIEQHGDQGFKFSVDKITMHRGQKYASCSWKP